MQGRLASTARTFDAEAPVAPHPAPNPVWQGRARYSLREPLVARARTAALLAACLLPLITFSIASRGDWLLDYQWQDNWSYLKYFHDWDTADPVLREFMNGDYKGARVAWIIPGFLVYRLFDALAANMALHFLVAAATVLLTFGIGARLFGAAAGAAATILASAFPGFYASGYPHAWSYQGSIANLYYLVLLWSLIEHARSVGRRQAWWALLAGAALALTILTATTYLAALPWALAFWFILRGRPAVREIAVSGAMVAAGVLLTVATLSAATYLAGGSPLFVLPLIFFSMRMASEPSFGGSLAGWLPRAVWLAFPAIVLLGGLATTIVLALRRTLLRAQSRAFLAAFVGFAGLWLMMFAFEATFQAYVQYEHYNFLIVGPAAIALAGVLRWLPPSGTSASQTGRDETRWPLWAFPLLGLLVILPQTVLDHATVTAIAAPLTAALRPWLLPGAAILSVLAGTTGLVFIGARLGRGGCSGPPVSWRALVPAGLCFGVACAFTSIMPGPFHVAADCRDARDNYLLVNDATRWLASEGWHATTRSWFPASDVLSRSDGCGDFDLALTYLAIEQAGMLWKINLQPVARIADLNHGDVRNVAEKRRPRLVILSQPGMADAYNRELIEWGRTSGVNPVPRPDEKRTFTRGSLSITVQVYRFR